MPPRTFRSPTPRLAYFQAPIAEPTRLNPSNPKWIQLCTAGSYVYRGEPVEITPATFDQIVANFRAHPVFDPAARSLYGKPAAEVGPLVMGGKYGVIALNFDHPPMGEPRPGHGWFLDVERRNGELWGLCFFDPEAYQGMLSGTWKWTSIEWSDDTISPKGERIGAYLSGVALTNDPFIQGMTPIQLSRRHHAAPGVAPAIPTLDELLAMLPENDRAYVQSLPAEQLETDEKAKAILEAARAKRLQARGPIVFFGAAVDVLCELRRLFALPETADVGAVIGELAKLRAWALGEMSPPLGVDVGELVADFRALLNLPTLSDPASIFAELDKLLARLAAETPEDTMPDPTPKITDNAGALGLARVLSLLSARLSAKLGTPVADDEASVMRAFDGMTGRYDEAMSHVQALRSTFGTDDAKAIADKIAALIALGDQMTALLGEVAQEHAAEEQAEGEMAAADVGQVMQAQRLDPNVAKGTQRALLLARVGVTPTLKPPTAAEIAKDPACAGRFLSAVRERREARGKLREAFLQEHGLADLARVQSALPAHLQGALLPALFGGAGAPYAPGAPLPGNAPPSPQQGQPQPMQFGNTWTMARVQQLPPGPNNAERIFAEVVRTEFNGITPAGPGYDRAWQRVAQISADLNKQQAQFT